jgi:hypothetical protein
MKNGQPLNKCCWENFPYAKRGKLNPYLTLRAKINSKWTECLNIRPKGTEENRGVKLLDIDLGQ